MARRKDHSREELRELILKAAWDLVEEQGPPGLTARKIANKIGYTQGTIYNVFNSMDDLIININGITLDKLHAVLSSPSLLNSKSSIKARLKKMSFLYYSFAIEHKAHWLLLFTYIFPENLAPPKWYHQKIQELFEPLETILAEIVTGRNKSYRLKIASRSLWSSVHGIYFLEETKKIMNINNQGSSHEMVNFMIETFITGLTAQKRS